MVPLGCYVAVVSNLFLHCNNSRYSTGIGSSVEFIQSDITCSAYTYCWQGCIVYPYADSVTVYSSHAPTNGTARIFHLYVYHEVVGSVWTIGHALEVAV